jgi:hypothetical protein
VHFLLSVKYRQMRKRMPAVIEGKPLPVETLTEKCVYWVLLAMNILSGPCKVWALSRFYFSVYDSSI